jgi:hypothetical protein
MTKVELIFFDAGGGHRNAATALCQVIERLGYSWQVRMVNLQELLDPLDPSHRLTGHRLQDLYNLILRKGWTLGTPQLLRVLQACVRFYHAEEVQLLARHWRQSAPDLVVSLIPHFNRALRESLSRVLPETPYVTVLTDLADYPPHFWIEPQEQYFICGSERAVQQARALGIRADRVYQASGMILNPRFYEPCIVDRRTARRSLGLDPVVPTGLVMFGGQGSVQMLDIARRLDDSSLPLQCIFVCGRNERLVRALSPLATRFPKAVIGFTKEIPYYMHLSDFFIGKPGPGALSEALAMKLPVIVERNAWTLPQERYNADWIQEKQVGLVVSSFRDIGSAVAELLRPDNFLRFCANAAALDNRAVFEIPLILHRILTEAGARQPVPA